MTAKASEFSSDHLPGRRRFGWYRPKPKGGLDVRIEARPIDEQIWNEFRTHTRVVELLRPYMIDYLALASDWKAVERVEDEIGAALTARLDQSMITIPIGVEANARAQQLVSNFLGASSAFRDRTASRLSRQFGSGSREAQEFKATTARLFDASFAYRVIYALRNYAQHHEVPISFVPINADRSPEGALICRIALHLNPTILLQNGKFAAKLRFELAAIGHRQLSLRTLLDEFMIAHRELMLTILNSFSPALGGMAHYAAAMYRTFEIPHDVVPVIWEGDDPAGGPQTQTRCIMCGFDEMMRAFDLRDELEKFVSLAHYRNDTDHAVIRDRS